jgi:hypothetical protein
VSSRDEPSAFSLTTASAEFLTPLIKKFYVKLGLPTLMRKTDYHTLAVHVDAASNDHEVTEKLDRISQVAAAARPRTE